MTINILKVALPLCVIQIIKVRLMSGFVPRLLDELGICSGVKIIDIESRAKPTPLGILWYNQSTQLFDIKDQTMMHPKPIK